MGPLLPLRFPLDFPFETPRLRLVPVAEHHADAIWQWSRDPRFNEHVLWRQPRIPLQAKQFIDAALAAWKAGVAFSYFAECKQSGHTLARVEVRQSRRRPAVAEVGMLIAPAVWNRGYATELTYFGLWFSFENMEREAVAIDAAAANVASNRLLTKLGLHCLGEQDFPLPDGGVARLNRYVLTRDEFQVRLLPVMQEPGWRLPTDAGAAAEPIPSMAREGAQAPL
ncbi:MAG: GNAT family N-acetyltransferase [Sutterellaceae bacterium]|nr:GNAT family N-acetyltransferase [Burkholderiaceae bacterium]MCX7900698.1 GNAT family N-acetyltransferase [Burkholderiaceae bacterium]MDW8429714.1 GNAT family N-acetyltransferase [Sutterellaceae bacterium]